MEKTLTAERARALLRYDPETGVLTWKVSRGRVKAGDAAGGLNADGYILVGIDGHRHYAHRLAWLMHTGEWPIDLIDHRNFSRSDNRLKNLRDVTNSVNLQNRAEAQSNSGTRVPGVHLHRGKYRAQIKVDGRTRYLGTYPTPEEVSQRFITAKRQLHAGCTI